MLFSVIRSLSIAALFGLSFVSAQNSTQTAFSCGTVHDPDAIAAAQALFPKNVGVTSAAARGPIQVVWHVIYDGSNNNEGNIPDAQIGQQIGVLNTGFQNIFSFVLVGVNRIDSRDWFNNVGHNTPAEKEMKGQLRRGGVATLNIYSVNLYKSSGYFGYAAFPWDYQQAPSLDGVLLEYRVVFGGSMTWYNTGRILVHEVGHWVGLLHTFQGGCSAPGDYVDDTPAEFSAASGCPVGRDSCPGGGLDPIENHMDYTDDACRTRFTNGQVQRAWAAVRQFRGI